MELAIAILGILTVLAKIFGPAVAEFSKAEIEKFRVKHPDQPNIAALMERARAVSVQVVKELETQDWGTMLPKEIALAKHSAAVNELIGDPDNQAIVGRLAAVGLNLNKDDADILIKQAVDVMNYLPGGRKAPNVPLEQVPILPPDSKV